MIYRTINKRSIEIHREWDDLCNSSNTVMSPYDSPNSYLKREVYRMVRSYLSKGTNLEKRSEQLRTSVIRDLEREGITFRSSQMSQKNPFYWGLMSVLAIQNEEEKKDRKNKKGDNEQKEKNKKNPVRRQDLHKFANELLYAHGHDVPPEFLVGFIYQIGSSDALKKRLSEGVMEDWYGQQDELA